MFETISPGHQAEMGVTQMTILSCELELEAENSASGLGVEERGVSRIKMEMNVCPPLLPVCHHSAQHKGSAMESHFRVKNRSQWR